MSVECFIDTNVFIYHLDNSDPAKYAVAERLISHGLETGDACTSFQVVQECLNTVLRKAEIPLDTDQARLYLDHVLTPLFTIAASTGLYHQTLSIQSRYRYSFYDSLIIAAALEAGCSRLYTEDLQHGQQIGKLTIQNPFLR